LSSRSFLEANLSALALLLTACNSNSSGRNGSRQAEGRQKAAATATALGR
jgi:hypothetical protein